MEPRDTPRKMAAPTRKPVARGPPCGTIRPAPLSAPRRPPVSTLPAAKFFVNQGVVSSRTDMLHLLRPLLKQTVTYRYLRGREVVSHGTGWVERIVVDDDDASTYFTPLAITPNTTPFRPP